MPRVALEDARRRQFVEERSERVVEARVDQILQEHRFAVEVEWPRLHLAVALTLGRRVDHRLAQRVGPQRDWDLDRLRVALDVLTHLRAAVGDRIGHHLRQRRHRTVEPSEAPRRRAVDVEEALAVAQRAQLREDGVAERRNVRPLVSGDGAVEALRIGLVLAADDVEGERSLLVGCGGAVAAREGSLHGFVVVAELGEVRRF